MWVLFLVMIASPPQHCPASPRPRIRFEASREDHARSHRAQEEAIRSFNEHDYQAALRLVESLVVEDSASLGADADAVVFDYALLALTQFEMGAPAEARGSVRRILGIPPAAPLFSFADASDAFSAIAIHFDVSLVDWSNESFYRFFVETLAGEGGIADEARAYALQWFGRSLTLDERLFEARIALETALETMNRVFGPSSPRRAECLFQLAIVDEALCDSQAARRHYVEGIRVALRGCEAQQIDALHYFEEYGRFLRDEGSSKEAEFLGSIEGSLRLQMFPLRGTAGNL